MIRMLAACALAYGIADAAPAARPCDLPDRRDTLELYLLGSQVGTFMETMERDTGAGARGMVTRLLIDARLPMGEGPDRAQRLLMEERRAYGPDGVLRSAFQRMSTASGENTWELTARTARRWVLRRSIGGVASEQHVADIPTDRIDNACRLYQGILKRSIRAGDTWRDTSYDLASGQRVISAVTCRAVPSTDNNHTWEFLGTDSGTGLEEQWLTDTNGVTLYRSVPPFFEGRRQGFAFTGQGPSGGSVPGSLTALFSVPADTAPRPDDGIVVKLDSGLSLPASGAPFYRREQDLWALQPFLSPCPAGLGVSGGAHAAAADTRATPTLQSTHPRIVALAESLTVARGDLCALMQVMCSHVHGRIRYRMHATYSSALETLAAGYGDCGEKAVLLAALLRARRVPAHVVLGLVHVPERQAYMGHAWVGVKTRAGWLCADPAMGVFPAGPGLVPLLVDDTGEHAMEVLRLVGRISISRRQPDAVPQ